MTPRPDDGLGDRERTLLVALLLSLWAPLATGLAVLLSRSTTQVADFVRRSAELVALVISWAVYRHLRRRCDLSAERRARLERLATRSVAAALATVLWAPGHPATRWVDLGGSVAVALYLGWSAWRTVAAGGRPTRAEPA